MQNINWVNRKAKITDDNGKIKFEMDVEAPDFWSDTAVSIVSNKYFKVIDGVQETSVKHLINRVVNTIGDWGVKDKYFDNKYVTEFKDNLSDTLVNQEASFNSPVYFNVGAVPNPQCSACFIVEVQDSMDSILKWYTTEGRIFQNGSGSGCNLSNLRSEGELLSGGGTASGPLSFMKAADESAGAIKSGGRTRRAAKLICLNVDHPDIKKFIKCKVHEEKLARTLLAAGWSDNMDGAIYQTLHYQNANNSVRVTDDFMCAVENDLEWNLIKRTTEKTAEIVKAKDLFTEIAQAAWESGDPGLQFDTTINKWHTRPISGKINSSNPCAEFLSLDNSACNLASLNLLKFINEDGIFDIDHFVSIVQLMIKAMDMLIDNSSYPTELIAKNAKENRELGLGYSNLGALIMYLGVPYDSDEGREIAASITSLLTSTAYVQSALLAKDKGPYATFELNKQDALRVVFDHMVASQSLIPTTDIAKAIFTKANSNWDMAYNLGNKSGYRNSQLTVIAPAGTISFMMDCDTTGIEPDIAPVKFKKLVGGGRLNIVNQTITPALVRLGYNTPEIKELLTYVEQNETFVGSKLKTEHLPIFDCANGVRYIDPSGHYKMMAAVQPFVSGGISKSVNLPNNATVQDIENVYLQSWKLGVKCIAVYRDGSKWTQPLNGTKVIEKKIEAQLPAVRNLPVRRRLPADRAAHVHKMEIGSWEGYLHAGVYEDGSPAELFIKGNKAGSTTSGLLDAIGILTSLGLQHGIPLSTIASKLIDTRFEPAGFTKHPKIKTATSILDYTFKWMLDKFEQVSLSLTNGNGHINGNGTLHLEQQNSNVFSANFNGGTEMVMVSHSMMSEQLCPKCESLMIRTGACITCNNCTFSSGSCG